MTEEMPPEIILKNAYKKQHAKRSDKRRQHIETAKREVYNKVYKEIDTDNTKDFDFGVATELRLSIIMGSVFKEVEHLDAISNEKEKKYSLPNPVDKGKILFVKDGATQILIDACLELSLVYRAAEASSGGYALIVSWEHWPKE